MTDEAMSPLRRRMIIALPWLNRAHQHSLCSLVLRRQRRRSAEYLVVLSNRTTARTVRRTNRSLKRASSPADASESSRAQSPAAFAALKSP
jgi:hypothetical protein